MLFLKTLKDVKFSLDGSAFWTFVTLSTKKLLSNARFKKVFEALEFLKVFKVFVQRPNTKVQHKSKAVYLNTASY